MLFQIFTACFYVTLSKKHNQLLGQAFLNARRQNDQSTKSIKINSYSTSRRSRCCPYDFDSSICTYVDDRILCGYNKNKGKVKSKRRIVKLSDGCRLRGKRVECGYEHGPFTNPRRPPAWDNQPPFAINIPSQNGAGPGEGSSGNQANWIEANRRDITYSPKRVTRCMEMSDDRVVCRAV